MVLQVQLLNHLDKYEHASTTCFLHKYEHASTTCFLHDFGQCPTTVWHHQWVGLMKVRATVTAQRYTRGNGRPAPFAGPNPSS